MTYLLRKCSLEKLMKKKKEAGWGRGKAKQRCDFRQNPTASVPVWSFRITQKCKVYLGVVLIWNNGAEFLYSWTSQSLAKVCIKGTETPRYFQLSAHVIKVTPVAQGPSFKEALQVAVIKGKTSRCWSGGEGKDTERGFWGIWEKHWQYSLHVTPCFAQIHSHYVCFILSWHLQGGC